MQLQQQLNVTQRRTRRLSKSFGSSLGNVLKRADIPSDAGIWAERVAGVSADKAGEYIDDENKLYAALLSKLDALEDKAAEWEGQLSQGKDARNGDFMRLLGDLEAVESELREAMGMLEETSEVAKSASSLEVELNAMRRALQEAEKANFLAEQEAEARLARAQQQVRSFKAGTGIALIGAAVGAILLLRSNGRAGLAMSALAKPLYSRAGSSAS